MEQDITIMQKNYEKASRLLGELFEVDSDITEQIHLCIRYYRVSNFFKNIEDFGFSKEVLQKLEAVRIVLLGVDKPDGGVES